MLHWGAVWKGPRRPEVALTFDDGPDPNYTTRVLDALQKAGIPATFFVIGQKAVRHPDIVGRMIRDGHEVQIHGWRHWFVPLLPPWTTLKQVSQTSRALETRFGIRTSLYRPTWGVFNLTGMLARLWNGHTTVTWSVMVGDWRKTPAEQLLQRITRAWFPGAIIVLHDSDETFGAETGAPEHVIELIPQLAEAARAKGYTFVRMSSWLEAVDADGAHERRRARWRQG
ncbi:MAG: polysaccharide deacetylase family protein [Alicyclobacillus sp.]|nr:polysaccharide deacetylase family protein [Alicyclobacillus sp.]